MKFKNQFTQIGWVLFFAFFIMMIIRLQLLVMYPSDFNDLTLIQTIQSLFMGFRVDTITLFTFSFIFIIPLIFIKNITARKVIGILWAVILLAIFTISFSDVLYFNFTHKHISNEVFNLGDDFNIITNIAFNSYLIYTVLASLFSLFTFYLFYTIFSTQPITFVGGKKLIIFSLIVLLILFLGIRNKTSGKSFGSSDAFAVSKISSGNLALNGCFTLYRAAQGGERHNLIDLNKAIDITKNSLYTPNATYPDENYPLFKSYPSKQKEKYNVVIVLLESWGAEHIDGFTKYKELNVTPFFKQLSNESLKFTNFYANGFRSIFGITSLFTGITLPSGFQYLGRGLELSNISYLGRVAKDNGYSTMAMQGGNRRSYRVDAVTHIAGFDDYYGAEDIPNIEVIEEGKEARTGTYDYNLLDFYNKKISELKEPFLSFAFTSTNHPDLYLPRAEFERYPHALNNYYGELNAYLYVDNAIEKFMNSAKKEPWFDRTIFIFTADHGNGDALNKIGKELRDNPEKLGSIEHYRIPLVIYAPKIFEPQEIKTLGSQNDIFPTIVDMLGFEANITTIGNSLFDNDVKERFVYLFGGDVIGLINNDGYIIHNFKKTVEKKGNNHQYLKELLFSVDTAEAELLQSNRWAK
ncbi:MAG: sulfatase-like hydrolase/transferase [Sulfurimonas sp.]|uniref:LTA synthase family protein n=1 Tax=Sulfurimonas sp. TaxID=2022749 RepID=UPI002610C9A6|nr:alkaline phosphatase family protein [Sulfurimonas sp.]MDD3477006.1 sulfatase-like hydrolase/transferase [Sulfurimonas sp.]